MFVRSSDVPVGFGMLDGFWVALYDPEGIEKGDYDSNHNENSVIKKEDEFVDKKMNFDLNSGKWLLIVKPVHADLSVILKIKDTYSNPAVNNLSIGNSLKQSKIYHLSDLLHSTSLMFNIHLSARTVDVSVQRSHLVLIRDAMVSAIQFMKEQQKKVYLHILFIYSYFYS